LLAVLPSAGDGVDGMSSEYLARGFVRFKVVGSLDSNSPTRGTGELRGQNARHHDGMSQWIKYHVQCIYQRKPYGTERAKVSEMSMVEHKKHWLEDDGGLDVDMHIASISIHSYHAVHATCHMPHATCLSKDVAVETADERERE